MSRKMKRFSLLLLFGLLFNLPPLTAQMQSYSQRSLFSDYKAAKVGDIVTILIVEQVQAANAANTREGTDSQIGATAQAGLTGTTVQPTATIRTVDELTGIGETNRRETIRARLSAQVIAVDSNGNLKIQGKRTTKINGETQTITLTGIIRPADLSADNTVYSTKIANMVLTIEGDGIVSETKEPGLITKFLRILF